jgi:hypothetical protein
VGFEKGPGVTLKVHPKGRKGDILILPFQAAPHSDLIGPVAGVGAKQFGGPEDPFVKNALYSLGFSPIVGVNRTCRSNQI